MEVPMGQIGNTEATFGNENVLKSLRNTGWFTPEYITQVVETEPEPERNPNFTFKDERLREFLGRRFPSTEGSVFGQIARFLSRSLLTRDGNTYPFKYIPFADKEFLRYAQSLVKPERPGHLVFIEDYDLDRMTSPGMPLMCMVAPEDIRKKVIKILCGWRPERDFEKKNVLLWTQLSRKGIKQYLDEHYPTGVRKLLRGLTARKNE